MEQAAIVTAIRTRMAADHGVNGFLIPRADEYQGEYVPARGERLAFATGFTGSAGMAVLLEKTGLVVTDSRYEIQIRDQVDKNLYQTLIVEKADDLPNWIAANARPGDVIGYDPHLHTPSQVEEISKILTQKNITLKPLATNPLDAVWSDQPPAPASIVSLYPDYIAGRSAAEKRDLIAKSISASGAGTVVLTKGETIAWLLNIRGDDVPHTPFALSYAFLHDNGDVDWFIDSARVPADVQNHLGSQVKLHDPATLEEGMTALAEKSIRDSRPVMIDPARSSIWFKQQLEGRNARLLTGEDPCLMPRAIKTPPEQAAIRNAHLRDGVAVTKFLCWLDTQASFTALTELDIADKLLEFRKMDPGFRDTSFDTIAGWGPNGAIVHYRATPEKHSRITPPGVLLLDSGGQYLEGTTDITRTIAIGEQTEHVKDAFTRVLKGHIAIAAAVFPVGTTGLDLDPLAHAALRAIHVDYHHGTGHGVGIYGTVHEEGPGISPRAKRAFVPGMLVSNEPGVYAEKQYGIRIESLILTQVAPEIDGKPALRFETVTLAPIDQRFIRPDIMDDAEIDWFNSYQARVVRSLSPYLTPVEKTWLQGATRPLKKSDAAVVYRDVRPFPG